MDVRNDGGVEETILNLNSVHKPTATFRTYILAATLGVSMGLNVFFALRVYKPELWHEIELAMIRPPVLRSDDHIRGPGDAQVTVIEYSDFQCTFCAQIHLSLKRLAEGGRIRWVYRNYPLSSIHPRALEAAEAAECAGDQGKFWEYADALFDLQRELEGLEAVGAFLAGLAKRVGLDEERFRKCLSSHQFEGRIRSQVAEANSKRIEATPTIFVNGKRQVGLLPFEQLEQLAQSQRK